MKLNYKKVILVGFAFFLISAFWQAYDSIVPMILVNKFGLSQSVSGIIMAIDNILAVVLLPLFGTLSDKTNSRFGKRTPYIVLGTILAISAFVGMTFADNAQLKNLYAEKNDQEFITTVWDADLEITNVEKTENILTKDYASRIYFNKDFEELTPEKQTALKNAFLDLANPESENKNIMYSYDNGVYTVNETGRNSIRTNLLVASRTAFAKETTSNNPAPLIVFICILLLVLVSMATFRSPAVALMPDVTVKPLRSKANAVINLMGTAGGIIVLALGIVFGTGQFKNQMMSYTVFVSAVCAVMAIGLTVFILKVREPKWSLEMQEEQAKLDAEDSQEETNQSSGEKLDKSKLISLLLILASVALWYMGYNAVTSKYSLYATNVLMKDYNSTLIIAQGAAIISYIPVGMLASKIGRKKTILIGVTVLAVAFFSAIFANPNTPLLVMYLIFALAGIGWATINVNSFPMVVELAKNSNVGKYTGYYYTASMAAQAITPWVSGLIMDAFGTMKPLFPYATIFVALAFVTMFFVKHGDARPDAPKSKLEMLGADD